MRRRLFPLLALPVLVPLFAGCSVTAPSALEVNGGSLSRQQLQSDLEMLRANDEFVKLLNNQGLSLNGGPKDPAALTLNNRISASTEAYNADIVASWLTREMYAVGVHQEVVAQGLELKPVTAAQKELINADFGGEEVFSRFPRTFRDRLVRYYRDLDALSAAQMAKLGSPKAYFAANPSEFPTEACVSHILVATEKEALAAKARIDKGEAFAEVAAELSIDPGSKTQGGALGCSELSGYVKEFADAAAKQPVNKVSRPVRSSFGYHLILVTERTESAFDAVKVKAAMQKKAEAAAVEALLPKLAGAKVDPRFGTVQVNAGSGPRVIAPGQGTL